MRQSGFCICHFEISSLIPIRKARVHSGWMRKRCTEKIAIQSLATMRGSLQKNICNLPSYGTLRMEIDPQTINQHLLTDLQYACRYWVHHLEQSEVHFTEMDNAFLFLQEHFLHWVEAMSILGFVSEVVEGINLLQSVIHVGLWKVLCDY